MRKGSGDTSLNPSLVPSHPHSPAENVWWFDWNILSVTPFSSGMWEEQQNRKTHSYMSLCHPSWKCRHDFILRFAIFVWKRELCALALCFFEGLGYKKPTYKQIYAVCKFAWGKDVASYFSSSLTNKIRKFAAPFTYDWGFNGSGTLLTTWR